MTGRVALFKGAATLLAHLPERVDVALGRSIARFAGSRMGEAQRHLRVNVAHALGAPGQNVDTDILDRCVSEGFANYGHYWAESAKLPGLRPDKIYSRFVIAEGLEYLEAARAKGRGVIIALPHVGSWEWGGAFLHSLGFGMTAVAEQLEPPAMFDFFQRTRRRIGIDVVPLGPAAGTALLTTLRRGGVVGLLCDRDIDGNGIDAEFMGETVSMPAGPATLALRTGAALVAAACYQGPGRDHFAVITPEITVERLAPRLRDDVSRITQDVTTVLEGLIRRAPDQWHVLQPRFGEQ